MTVYIYGLFTHEPEGIWVRYVGQTVDLVARLKQHLADQTPSYKVNWIKSKLREGKKIEMFIYDTLIDTTQAKADEVECEWIARMRLLGNNLVNATHGGRGHSFLPETFCLRCHTGFDPFNSTQLYCRDCSGKSRRKRGIETSVPQKLDTRLEDSYRREYMHNTYRED